jgi:hypothetical protein
VVTAFILPLLTSLITSRIVDWQVANGKLSPLAAAQLPSTAWLRRSRLQRGAALGGLVIVIAALPVITVFALGGLAKLSFAQFFWFKASFAALIGAPITPLVGWWALNEASLHLVSHARTQGTGGLPSRP